MKTSIPAITKPLHFKTIDDEFNMDLSTSIVGYEKCTKSKSEIELKKSLFILHYVISGKGQVKYQNKWINVSKDHCFIFNPGQKVRYRPDKDDPWEYFWIEFSGNLAKKLVDAAEFANNDYILKIHNSKAMRKVINKMLSENSIKLSSMGETLRIQSLVFSIFSILINEYHKEEVFHKNNNTEEQVSVITQYVNTNFTSPDLTVQKIANEFAFNPSYLSRIFKQYNGISPAKYIILLRMKTALSMLKENRYTISQISFALGYKNQFYFSNEFKKHYGLPPSEYFKI